MWKQTDSSQSSFSTPTHSPSLPPLSLFLSLPPPPPLSLSLSLSLSAYSTDIHSTTTILGYLHMRNFCLPPSVTISIHPRHHDFHKQNYSHTHTHTFLLYTYMYIIHVTSQPLASQLAGPLLLSHVTKFKGHFRNFNYSSIISDHSEKERKNHYVSQQQRRVAF